MHTKYISETFGFILSLISFRQIDPVPSPCVDGDVHPRRREALIQIKVSVPLQISPFHSPGPHPSTKVDQGSLRCSQVLFRRVKYLWTSPPPSAVKASHGGPNCVWKLNSLEQRPRWLFCAQSEHKRRPDPKTELRPAALKKSAQIRRGIARREKNGQRSTHFGGDTMTLRLCFVLGRLRNEGYNCRFFIHPFCLW